MTNKTDQKLIERMNYICSEDIYVSPKEVAGILGVSEDKIKSLTAKMVADAPKQEELF